ncbi:hypothetical protein ARMGADRAFT_1028106 [Armillaria gallica]|uniref:Uncharacterized protein n=1 Tax=Armillaria gallica TaxID=47427 RepID=A0A2H3DYA2_ARMGA|nr:hypothetical protein ARMGADRAFT_1028106 [Armillaria gallica]
MPTEGLAMKCWVVNLQASALGRARGLGGNKKIGIYLGKHRLRMPQTVPIVDICCSKCSAESLASVEQLSNVPTRLPIPCWIDPDSTVIFSTAIDSLKRYPE